jgi:hypothetical protein
MRPHRQCAKRRAGVHATILRRACEPFRSKSRSSSRTQLRVKACGSPTFFMAGGIMRRFIVARRRRTTKLKPPRTSSCPEAGEVHAIRSLFAQFSRRPHSTGHVGLHIVRRRGELYQIMTEASDRLTPLWKPLRLLLRRPAAARALPVPARRQSRRAMASDAARRLAARPRAPSLPPDRAAPAPAGSGRLARDSVEIV